MPRFVTVETASNKRSARRLSPVRLEHWQQRMPDASARQLARAMGVDPSTVSRALARQQRGGS